MAVHELLEGGLIPSPSALDELVLRSWPAHHCLGYAGRAFEVPGHPTIFPPREPLRHRRHTSGMYRILAAALLALAIAPPVAAAKEIEQVQACGAEGCRTVDSPGGNAHGLFPSENLPAETPQAGPFYRLRIGIGDGSGKVFDTFTVLWAPRGAMLANDEPSPAWFSADPATEALALQLTKGLRAYPAADMPGARPPAAKPAPAATDSGTPWLLLAGVLAAVGALAALLVRPARRRAASRAARRAFQPPSPGRG